MNKVGSTGVSQECGTTCRKSYKGERMQQQQQTLNGTK